MEFKKYTKWAFLAYGGFLLLLPHTMHQKYSLDWVLGIGFPHAIHIFIGVALVIYAYTLLKG